MNEIINIAEILTDVDIALYESQTTDFMQVQGNPENTIQNMILMG